MIEHFSKYKKLAEKHNLKVDVVQAICDSQFEFTSKIIAEGNDEQVYLQYLGTFHVKPGKREGLKRRREKLKKLRESGKFKNG